MPPNPARRQAFGLTPDEEDEIIARAARDIAAPSDDDLPVIDLGDEAEVFIPREVPVPEPMPVAPIQSQAPGASPGRPSPTSSVQRAPEPGSFAAASPVVDEPVDDRFDVLGRPLTITSGTGIVPGLADDDEEDPGEPPDTAPTSSTATPSPDDEPIGPEPQMAVRPEQPIERVAPLRKRYGTTPDDVVALGRASDQDRRRRIGRGILGTVGALAGILGAATGRVGLGALGSTAFAGAGGLRPDRRQTLQAEIDARNDRLQAGDDAAAAASLAQRQMDLAEQRSAQEAANAARRGALAERQAEADIALDEARVAQLQQEAGIEALNRAALDGDTEAQRNILRALVNGLNDNSPLADNLRAAVNDPSFDGASLETLNQMQEDVTRLAATRHTRLITGGGGGGGTRVVTDPTTGLTRLITVGGRSAPAGAAARPSAPARPAAPRPAAAPAPSDAQTPDPELAALAAAYPGLTGPEFDIARAEMMRRRLSIEDLQTPAGQGVIRAAVNAYRQAASAGQATMLQGAGDVYASQVGGDVPMPPTVNPRVFAQVVRPMIDVYQGWVQPFDRARAALREAREAGASEAAIRIALQGGNNDALARVATAQMMPALRRLKTQAALMGELFGREQSGAAISESEWSQFRNILGTQNIYLTGSDQFEQTMRDLGQYGRSLVENRATPAGEFAGDYVSYFYESLRSARRRRPRGSR